MGVTTDALKPIESSIIEHLWIMYRDKYSFTNDNMMRRRNIHLRCWKSITLSIIFSVHFWIDVSINSLQKYGIVLILKFYNPKKIFNTMLMF